MIDQRTTNWHKLGTATLTLFATLFVGGVLLHWSWNLVAGELFQAPAMQFRHAIATELLLIVVAAATGFSLRFAGRCAQREKKEPRHAAT